MCVNPIYVRDPNYSSRRLATFFLPFVGPLIYRTGETSVPLSFLFCLSNRRIMEEDFHFSLYMWYPQTGATVFKLEMAIFRWF